MSPVDSSRGLRILKIVMYVLAALFLIPGVITSIILITSAGSMTANAMLAFQIFGGGALANMLGPMVRSLLVNLGLIVLVISLALGASLFGIGRLIEHIDRLEARLAHLEAAPHASAPPSIVPG